MLVVRNASTSAVSVCETAIGVTQIVLKRDGSKITGEVGEVRSFDSVADTVRGRQRDLAPGEAVEVPIPTVRRAQAIGMLETQPLNTDGSGTAGLRWTRWIDGPGNYELSVYYRKDLSSPWTPSNSVSFEVTP